MQIITMASVPELEQRAVKLLAGHFTVQDKGQHAVMLTGGHTPLGVYRRIAEQPPTAGAGLHLLISDERFVPLSSSENNYAHLVDMIDALGISDDRVMRVVTEKISLEESADRYDRRLSEYFAGGGRITLGILGLGADGHVASLFAPEDIQRGGGRCAIAVHRTDGPDRVSVTRDVLRRLERTVLLVTGSRKREIVQRMRDAPLSVVAGQVLEGHARVELWFADDE